MTRPFKRYNQLTHRSKLRVIRDRRRGHNAGNAGNGENGLNLYDEVEHIPQQEHADQQEVSDDGGNESEHMDAASDSEHMDAACDSEDMDAASDTENDYHVNDQAGTTDDEEGSNHAPLQSENSDNDLQSDEEGGEDQDDVLNCDNDFNFVHNLNKPLYTGAPLTVSESMSLILTLIFSHSLTQSCVSDLLTVINMHCIQVGLHKLSIYRFRKFFAFDLPMNKIYYCSKCCRKLQLSTDACRVCGRAGVSFFMQFPLIPQLAQLLARKDFYNLLQHRFRRQKTRGENIEDIYDGKLYQKFFPDGILGDKNNISFMWNSDGIPAFKSKNYSIWPFFLAINELPFKERFKRKNVILCGIWCGVHKPNTNVFVDSFKEDFKKIYKGVTFQVSGRERVKVRGLLLTGTSDTPAKSTFLNFKHHNGYHGCSNCETEGEELGNLPGKGKSIHVYRYVGTFIKRTVSKTLEYARLAPSSQDRTYMGVKAVSALWDVMPDFLEGMGIDMMHLVSGVLKKLLTLWFDSKHSSATYSLRDVRDIIDKLLLSIKPPQFVHRLPRSIEDMAHMKASELKVLLFYYLPVILRNTMRPDYYCHFIKFVIAMYYLNCSSISEDMICVADELLHQFVKDFESLYGLRFCSINIHMLLHLADCVRNLGPLWCYSCFPFEDLNGQILRDVHGTRYVDSQIAQAHWRMMKITKVLEVLQPGEVLSFCLHKKRQVKILCQIQSSCYAVGSFYELKNAEMHVTSNALQTLPGQYDNFDKFLRLLKGGLLYTSKHYSENKLTTSSSYCSYFIQGQKRFGLILWFVKATGNCLCRNECQCVVSYFAVVQKLQLGHQLFVERPKAILDYMYMFRESEDVVAVPVENLNAVCFFIHVDNEHNYIAEPVNNTEVE